MSQRWGAIWLTGMQEVKDGQRWGPAKAEPGNWQPPGMKGEGESPGEPLAGVLALNYTGAEVVRRRGWSGRWRARRDVWTVDRWCGVLGAKLNLEKVEVVAGRTRETAGKSRWPVRPLSG